MITAIDGKPVERDDAISRALATKRSGDTLDLTIYRNGKTIDVRVRLGEFDLAGLVVEGAQREPFVQGRIEEVLETEVQHLFPRRRVVLVDVDVAQRDREPGFLARLGGATDDAEAPVVDVLILGFGALAQAFAPNVAWLIAIRFVLAQFAGALLELGFGKAVGGAFPDHH